MTQLILKVLLNYDGDMMYGDDPEGKEWFLQLLYEDDLLLYSSDVGDHIGEIIVVSVDEKQG